MIALLNLVLMCIRFVQFPCEQMKQPHCSLSRFEHSLKTFLKEMPASIPMESVVERSGLGRPPGCPPPSAIGRLMPISNSSGSGRQLSSMLELETFDSGLSSQPEAESGNVSLLVWEDFWVC